jgi:hypothetical protein
MRKLIFFLFGSILINGVVNAQKISGVVKDEQGNGVAKATISLLSAKDSSSLKLAITDKDGLYSFSPEVGEYVLTVSHVGYVQTFSQKVVNTSDVTVPDLQIFKAEAALSGVTVSSRKPMVEVKADRTILNVEGTINATGNDALELLRKAPGVLIDKDDNISLAGKNGVQIFIDGKPTPLAGADLAAYLKSLQSAQVESIELITNPSAKYEAAGNAGIINIKLKKNKTFGTNGSVNAGYNIGVYPKYNGGLALNHRNKSMNIFGNYNYNNTRFRNKFNLYREVDDAVFDTRSIMEMDRQSHGFKAGADLFLSSRSTLGVMLNGNFATDDFESNSRTPIVTKSSGIPSRILVANNTNDNQRRNVNYNINYRYTDTSGREFNLDGDYGSFRIKGNQLQPNFYYDPVTNDQVGSEIYRFLSPSDIDILSTKGDYEQNYKGGRLGVGFKLSLIKTDNYFARYDVQQLSPEMKTLDVDLSNQFEYSENINAFYVNYNKQYKGFMFQAGVRVENTKSTGDSYPLNPDGTVNKDEKATFERKYTDFFPSAALTFNKNPMSQWGLSYSRRIDRPAYQDLNPFEFKLDAYSYMKGNTLLKPQYTNIFSLTNTYKYMLTTTLSYSHVSDIFSQVVNKEDSSSYMTKENLADQDVINLSVSYPFSYKAYSAFASFNGNYSRYQADLSKIPGDDREVDLSVFSFNIYMQHSLKIGKKGWVAEVSGWFNSPSVWGGMFETNSLWSVDAGVQKPVFKGKGNLKVSVSDIFYSIRWKGESNFDDQRILVSGYGESRQLRASLTWRFGSNEVKAARQRKTGLEDESKRTQSSGGIGQ